MVTIGEDIVTTAPDAAVDGDASIEVDAAVTGPGITVAVQPHMIRDAIATCGSKHVRLTFTDDPKRAFVVQPCDGDGVPVAGYHHVVMVMNTAAARKATK
jgi:hypothetical protein